MSIIVKNIQKKYGDFEAIHDLSLECKQGELTALLGPSGSGKTTLLRIIAGLEQTTRGTILCDGQNITSLSARERGVGFVFQHYALFKHMSVFDNVAFGLDVKPKKERPSVHEKREIVMSLLELVQLSHAAERFPHELSGGQRQRVALARALATKPSILLLDEPFGALDAQVRGELRRWLRKLHDETQLTSIFVTHDQEEALEVADTIVVMNKGAIEQVGTPTQVYEHPKNGFVCRFLGNVNIFHEREAFLYVRPHEVNLTKEYVQGSKEGQVSHIRRIGPIVRLEVELKETLEVVEATMGIESYISLNIVLHEKVFVSFDTTRVYDKEIEYLDYTI